MLCRLPWEYPARLQAVLVNLIASLPTSIAYFLFLYSFLYSSFIIYLLLSCMPHTVYILYVVYRTYIEEKSRCGTGLS